MPSGASAAMAGPVAPEVARPGDEAPPGTAGTGEALCRGCNGSGEHHGSSCRECGGTGKVIQGIGGA